MSEATWKCTLQELSVATGGKILSQHATDFSYVGSDTRKNLSGMLFIALKGDSFDAHQFVGTAVQQGAVVVMVHEWREEWRPLLEKVSFIQVKDTLLALQSFGQYWRRKHKFKVLAVTGSNGKTSTKEFTKTLLKDHISVYASVGSYNNHWGVPFSILQAGPEHKVLILEMGMNQLGELWRLCQIAEPDVVAVTMVGRSHIGELGSQANIAKAKEEVYLAAPKAVHIFNMDNEWTMRMQSKSQSPQITFSAFRAQCDVYLRAQRLTWEGLDLVGHIKNVKGQTWVNVIGRHNTVNLMCAASLALSAGLTPEQIWHGFSLIRDSAWGRNQVVSLTNGAQVLFDAYNANPDSMQALFKNLYEMDVQGQRLLVVGDMLELGSFEDSAHEELGERAGSVGFDAVWYVGKNSDAFQRGFEKSGATGSFVASAGFDPEISKSFLAKMKSGDLIAVKASRGMHLEDVVQSWPMREPLGTKP